MSNLIGMKEMARNLGISVKALRIRVSKGKIDQPVKRVGSELFWARGTGPLGVIGDTESLDIYMHPVLPMNGLGAKPLDIDDNVSNFSAIPGLTHGGGARGQMYVIKGRQPDQNALKFESTGDLGDGAQPAFGKVDEPIIESIYSTKHRADAAGNKTQ